MCTPVPIPSSCITYKKSPDPKARYVYAVVHRYRNKHNTPTADERSIGKEIPDRPGWMMPNKNYAVLFPELYAQRENPFPEKTKEAGQGLLLSMMAEGLGLRSLLQEVFPENHEELLFCAIYMITQGNVMMNTDFFFEQIQLPENFYLPSRRISDLFANITKEQIQRFFTRWSTQVLCEEETLAYDVTSISTYADLELAEFGYNRDREYLPQVNLGLLYGALCHLPIAYTLYSGSINDLSYFSTMMSLAEEIGARDLFFIFDRGFLTKENLLFTQKEKISFLAGVSKDEVFYSRAMREVREELRGARYRLREEPLHGIKQEVQLHGSSYGLYIYLSKENAAKEENRIYEHILRLEEEMKTKMKPQRQDRYGRYYALQRSKQGVILSYEKDYEKIEKACSLAGMFAFLSTDTDMTPEEALALYKHRDEIEKIYGISKNELQGDRFLIHSSKALRGKSFVHFLALLLYADLKRKAKGCEKKPERTLERMLLEMKKVRCVHYAAGNVLEEPLTKKQKDILECCGIDQDVFVRRVLRGEV